MLPSLIHKIILEEPENNSRESILLIMLVQCPSGKEAQALHSSWFRAEMQRSTWTGLGDQVQRVLLPRVQANFCLTAMRLPVAIRSKTKQNKNKNKISVILKGCSKEVHISFLSLTWISSAQLSENLPKNKTGMILKSKIIILGTFLSALNKFLSSKIEKCATNAATLKLHGTG